MDCLHISHKSRYYVFPTSNYSYYFLIIPFLESQRSWCHDESPSRTRWNKNYSGKLSLKRVTKSSNFWSPLHPRKLGVAAVHCYQMSMVLVHKVSIVLSQHNTMESLLERGEKLDDLVQKSEHLGNQSKAFYKTASDFAHCCFRIILRVKASIFCAAP